MLDGTIREILLPAFAECLVLTGLHAYLGLHVLRRQVIFVDLTLAQIAALGTTVGLLFGLATDSPGAYLLSLSFTILGAAIFTVTRMRTARVPQEAVIGLIYAIAAALAILLVASGPHGSKEVQSIMTGRLLWVDWSTVGLTAAVYSLLGIIHWFFRRPFWKISNDPAGARAEGMRIYLWDFLFYVTFGIAISLSVRTAGVLLVFVFLVVPAMVALMISSRPGIQLLIGWIFGTLVTAGGLMLSYYAKLPSGPTVVTFYGLILAPIAVIIWFIRSGDRMAALRKAVAGAILIAVFSAGFVASGSLLKNSKWAHCPEAHARHAASGQDAHRHDFEHSDEKQPEEYSIDPGDYLNAEVAAAAELAGIDSRAAAGALLEILKSEAFPFDKEEAKDALSLILGTESEFDITADPDDDINRKAIEDIEKMIEELQ